MGPLVGYLFPPIIPVFAKKHLQGCFNPGFHFRRHVHAYIIDSTLQPIFVGIQFTAKIEND